MLTNNQYKIIAHEIAALFCESSPTPVVCEAATFERLNQLSNSEFSFVLQNLSVGRFYIANILGYETRGDLCWYTMRMVDLLTGVSIDYGFSTAEVGCQRCPTISCLKSKFVRKGWNIVSGNKEFSASNYRDTRLLYVPADPSYGLTYVSGSVGGGTVPSEPIVPGSGGDGFVQPTQNPDVSPTEAGFDFGSLLSNPIVLYGGIALIAYYLLVKK